MCEKQKAKTKFSWFYMKLFTNDNAEGSAQKESMKN